MRLSHTTDNDPLFAYGLMAGPQKDKYDPNVPFALRFQICGALQFWRCNCCLFLFIREYRANETNVSMLCIFNLLWGLKNTEKLLRSFSTVYWRYWYRYWRPYTADKRETCKRFYVQIMAAHCLDICSPTLQGPWGKVLFLYVYTPHGCLNKHGKLYQCQNTNVIIRTEWWQQEPGNYQNKWKYR